MNGKQKINPCYKCEERTFDCHTKCQDYKKFDAENKIKREEIFKRHIENSMMISYKCDKVKRVKKK